MIAFDEFIREDQEKAYGKSAEDSLIYRVARALWLRALKGARAEMGESWSLAVVEACAPGRSPVNPPWEYNRKKYILDNVLPSFCATLLRHKKKLERDPLWIEASSAEDPVDSADLLEKFLWGCGERWRLDCVDKRRDSRGTFAHVHRRSQKLLRKTLPLSSWATYGPKSRHYGPQGMIDPPYLDECGKAILESISLPKDAPEENRVFFEKYAVPLAKWFYSNLNMLRSEDEAEFYERPAVAIRNYARWLCLKYPGLLSSEVQGRDTEMEQAMDGKTEGGVMESEVRQIARDACQLLTRDQREIVKLRIDGLGQDEIAAKFRETGGIKKRHLADSRGVQRELARIQRIVRDFRMKSPLFATDEDSMEDQDQDAEKMFIHYFVKMCANPSE